MVPGDQEAPVPAAEAGGGCRQHRGGRAAGEQRQVANFLLDLAKRRPWQAAALRKGASTLIRMEE